jgi:periplasmic protein TonB
MNRFQKKCFIVVAAMHGLLLLVLIVGTAFLKPEKKIEPSKVITLVSLPTVTDGPTRGGASPAPAPAPAPTPVPAPVPVAQPPEVQPKPAPTPEPIKALEKPKPKPVEPVKVAAEIPKVIEKPKPVPTPKPAPKPTRMIPDLNKPIIRKPSDNKAAIEAAEKAEREKAIAERAATVRDSLNRIGQNLSPSTTIETSGGTDGAAEINYRDLVLSKYDAAWIAPNDVEDTEANTKVRVVIARNGNVISAEIISASRNAKLDASVRRTITGLRYIHPFPESSKDSQRTFIINFNLKARRGIG